jgi:hypothetical protein
MGTSGVLSRLVAAGSLVLVSAGSAHAAPPVGCVGFPSIPQAYVCITQFTPANQVPTVTQGPGQTFVVPAFCAFSQCVGPTPVTVPDVTVVQGEGALAVITYNGSTYTVPVVQAPVMTFSATMHENCFGCGVTQTQLAGSFSGVVHGHVYSNASLSGSGGAQEDPGSSCVLTGSGDGAVTVADSASSDSAAFHWLAVGSVMLVTFSGGFDGDAVATHAALPDVPGTCGRPNVDFLVEGVGVTL